MEIKNGNLLINDKVIYRLSEIKPPDVNITSDEAKLNENNIFLMEVGRTLFIKMKLCNEANLCRIREVAEVVITGDQTKMATSENGTKIGVSVALPDVADRRRKRETHSLTVETPDGKILHIIHIHVDSPVLQICLELKMVKQSNLKMAGDVMQLKLKIAGDGLQLGSSHKGLAYDNFASNRNEMLQNVSKLVMKCFIFHIWKFGN